ncbi:MAG: hypothetical protein HFJ40_02670 [Clostridia bacterium]|nr:hypothetical protein [Clostridia bacterium]
MKKFKKLAYIVLIVIIFVLSLTVYTNATKDDSKSQKEKTYSEIKYLESKLVNLLNSMNNIEARNYKVSVSETTEQSTKKTSDSNSSSSDSSGGSGGGGEESSSDSGSSSSSQESSGTKQDSKKFELKSEGVLTTTENINWDSVKSEIEVLYTSLPTITLDLYQLDINKDDILNFNKEFDNLTTIVKGDKKEETLKQLSKLYDYIPKFVQNATDEEGDKALSETKSNIFKAYSKLDSQNWNDISNDIKSAIDVYSRLITNTNISADKQYHISKSYIMLNELQNAVNVKDKSVFLIKYKNLIEEFNNM